MEQLFDWMATAFKVMLAGAFALTPGMVFWLAVLSVFIVMRRVARSGPYQRLRHGDRAA